MWLIDSTERPHLVQWMDGKYEWIHWELAFSSYNRRIEYRVRGQDMFYTRREAERAISRLPFSIHLERRQGDSLKTWFYGSPRQRPEDSSAGLFESGDIAAVACGGIRTFGLLSSSDTYLTPGTLVLIVETKLSGALALISVGDETGWLESRYLRPVQGAEQ